jgi:hypothetical protein
MNEKNEAEFVLIPDYRFADRVGLDNAVTGVYHKGCKCKVVKGYIGKEKVMGERCTTCGFTVWLDPFNGGIGDMRDKEIIWAESKKTEAILNSFGIAPCETEFWK